MKEMPEMDIKKIKDQILLISNKLNIKVKYVEDDIENFKDFLTPNSSWILGKDEIVIGQYEDPELLFISFFHEIGHTLLSKEFIEEWNHNTLLIEIECWHLGIKYAKENNIYFSDKAIEYGYTQALSYVGHDEREKGKGEPK